MKLKKIMIILVASLFISLDSKAQNLKEDIDQQTKSTVESFMAAIGAHDMKKIENLVAPEVDWFVPGIVPWAGRHSKNTEVHEFFEKLGNNIVPAEAKSENQAMLINGENAIAFSTATQVFKKTGLKMKTEMALHFKVKNNKIIYFHLYEDTLEVAKAFGLSKNVE